MKTSLFKVNIFYSKSWNISQDFTLDFSLQKPLSRLEYNSSWSCKHTINPGDMTAALHSDTDIHTLKPLLAKKKNRLLNLFWRQKIHETFSSHVANAYSTREILLNKLSWSTRKWQHSGKNTTMADACLGKKPFKNVVVGWLLNSVMCDISLQLKQCF